MEKTFCCINAKARDFAKLGRLYLNKGNWNGEQLLPAEWVKQSITAEMKEGGVSYYKYQWWLSRNGYYADGLHGQFVYVNPSKNLIIVRLGKRSGDASWPAVFEQLASYL